MNDLVTSSRVIARTVLSWPFDPVEIAQTVERSAVVDALDGYRKALIPAHKLTKGERQNEQQELAKALRSIGLRIRPDFSEDQARTWLASMVDALDNYPLRIAIAAARDAKRHPIQYPAEVLAVVQDKAEPHLQSYERAVRNLEKLLKEIDDPTPKLTASDDAKAEAERISHDELQTMPDHLRQLGLSAGFLVEETDGGIRWATDDEQDAHRERLEAERRHTRARKD